MIKRYKCIEKVGQRSRSGAAFVATAARHCKDGTVNLQFRRKQAKPKRRSGFKLSARRAPLGHLLIATTCEAVSCRRP